MDQDPFEALVDDYDAWFERNRPTYMSELSAIRSLLPQGRGLEVGVGTGRFAAPLGVAVGLDPSLPMLRTAARRGIAAVRGLAERLPFRDGSFDLVLMVTVLCFSDPLPSLREAFRVTGPKGRLIVGLLDRDSPVGMEYAEKAAESRFYRNASFLSFREAEELITEAGWRLQDVRQTVLGGKETEPVLDGHGKGLFVAIMAGKE